VVVVILLIDSPLLQLQWKLLPTSVFSPWEIFLKEDIFSSETEIDFDEEELEELLLLLLEDEDSLAFLWNILWNNVCFCSVWDPELSEDDWVLENDPLWEDESLLDDCDDWDWEDCEDCEDWEDWEDWEFLDWSVSLLEPCCPCSPWCLDHFSIDDEPDEDEESVWDWLFLDDADELFDEEDWLLDELLLLDELELLELLLLLLLLLWDLYSSEVDDSVKRASFW
jgi:hypothetical protein